MTTGPRGGQGTDHGPLPAALAELLGPDLPGAACTGHPRLFDPPTPGETPETLAHRRRAAYTLCQSCPVLDHCSQAIDEFEQQRGSRGFVLGGRTVQGQP